MSDRTSGTRAQSAPRIPGHAGAWQRVRRARALIFAPLLLVPLASAGGPVAAQSGEGRPLSAAAIVAAFHHAGLAIDRLQRQPAGGDSSPGEPPPTEREAWGFIVRGQAHGDGRILLFATARGRDAKAAWFRRFGVRVLVRRDAIVWLDQKMAPVVVARLRHALEVI